MCPWTGVHSPSQPGLLARSAPDVRSLGCAHTRKSATCIALAPGPGHDMIVLHDQE